VHISKGEKSVPTPEGLWANGLGSFHGPREP